MTTATVRELRTEFPRLEKLLGAGESITITKRKVVVARLVPAGLDSRPDFPKRFGGRPPAAGRRNRSAVTLLLEERGE